jgi:thiol-disulfide isomerase/thioredoxin
MTSRRFVPLIGVLAIGLAWLWAARGQDSQAEKLKGQPAPSFSLTTLDGQKAALADAKGRVVLIDFWATWCPPCRKSLPHVQRISTDKARVDKGLLVWAVNAKETKDQVQGYLDKNHYTFTVPMDTAGSAMEAYSVEGIPTTVVVGRDGKVRDVFVGYGEGSDSMINKAIDAALAEPAPR